MEVVVKKWVQPQKMPDDILLEISVWTGMIIALSFDFDEIEMSTNKSKYLSSYCHFKRQIGMLRIENKYCLIYLNNFVTAWNNWWFISIKPRGIIIDSNIETNVIGRVESYEKAAGGSSQYQFFDEHIDNETVPWHLTKFITSGAPYLFLPPSLQKPKKYIQMALEFDKFTITSYAYLRHIFCIFVYIFCMFICNIYLLMVRNY